MNKQEDYALSINEVAELLGVSYWTIYAKRHELGFRLPGGRKWYIWRSALDNFGKKRNNVFRLSVLAREDTSYQYTEKTATRIPSGGLTSGHQAAKELDDLLAQGTKKKPKSTTTA